MKKKMRTVLATILAFGMIAGLTACDGGGAGGGKVKGETYETSLMTFLVPDGWTAFPKADFFEQYPDEPGDPHGLRMHKGAKDEFDQFSTPGIQIDYFETETEMYDVKQLYEDAEDIEPFTTGDYTWEGFTATTADTDLIVIHAKEPHKINVNIFPSLGDKEKITLKDADVQAILSNIVVK